MTEEHCLPDDLPCPSPLPEAVVAGVFGNTEDGWGSPDQEEVRAITAEHALEMITLLSDLTYVEWCSRHRLDPTTGRSPKLYQQEQLIKRLQQASAELAEQYEGCLTVYASAFGCEASESLDSAVRRFVATRFPAEEEAPAIQRELF